MLSQISVLKDAEYRIILDKLNINEPLPDIMIKRDANSYVLFANIPSDVINRYKTSGIDFKIDDDSVIATINLKDIPEELVGKSDTIILTAMMSITNIKVANDPRIKEFLTEALKNK